MPGPGFVDRVFSASDRSPRVQQSLQQLSDHGRLSASGYLSLLPVDQGVDHDESCRHCESRTQGASDCGRRDATTVLKTGTEITLRCAQGDVGNVYAGSLPFDCKDIMLDSMPETKTDIMINAAFPDAAFRWWQVSV